METAEIKKLRQRIATLRRESTKSYWSALGNNEVHLKKIRASKNKATKAAELEAKLQLAIADAGIDIRK